MGIASIGIPGLILIIVLALIVFGPKKLPEIGKAAGESLKAFKTSVDDKDNDQNKEMETDKDNDDKV